MERTPNEEWQVGDTIVHTHSGNLAIVHMRKSTPDDNPFPGWWVVDTSGVPKGGIADWNVSWSLLSDVIKEINARPECSMCPAPLGSKRCTHIWERDGEVTMAVTEWESLQRLANIAHAMMAHLEDGGELSRLR